MSPLKTSLIPFRANPQSCPLNYQRVTARHCLSHFSQGTPPAQSHQPPRHQTPLPLAMLHQSEPLWRRHALLQSIKTYRHHFESLWFSMAAQKWNQIVHLQLSSLKRKNCSSPSGKWFKPRILISPVVVWNISSANKAKGRSKLLKLTSESPLQPLPPHCSQGLTCFYTGRRRIKRVPASVTSSPLQWAQLARKLLL